MSTVYCKAYNSQPGYCVSVILLILVGHRVLLYMVCSCPPESFSTDHHRLLDCSEDVFVWWPSGDYDMLLIENSVGCRHMWETPFIDTTWS